MPDVNFLRANPVVQGMQQAQQLDASRARSALAEMEVEQARERARGEQAATQALNRIYAEGGDLSTAGINRRLAADPNITGGRRLQALQTAETDERQRMQTEAQAQERNARAFKMYLENGLDAAAQETAKRMGMNIPPSFWTDQAQRRALLNRLEVQERQARVSQAQAAAGASRALAQSRQPDAYEDFTDDQGRLVRRDKATGRAQYILGPDGQPIRSQSRDGVRADIARDTNATRLRIAELQARARTEQGAQRDATLREIARMQTESREAVALGNQGAALSRTEAQQEGAGERAQMGGARGARPSDREVRFEMAKKYGLTDQEAAGVAAGVVMTPGQRTAINERIQRGVINDRDLISGNPRFRTPQEQQAEIARRRADVFGDGAAPSARNEVTRGAPVAPNNAADIPRGPDGKVSQRELVDGQVYLIPLKKGGQTTGRWNAQTGRFDEVN